MIDKLEPKLSKEWQVYLFGGDENGFIWTPQENKVPNWFWRKMQYLILGNKWIRIK
mgnify:CR=1 FL=1